MIYKVNPLIYELDYSKYSNNINEKYIEIIKKDEKNRMIISCVDNIDDNQIISFIIYRKIVLKNEINFIILLISVHEDFRSNGYGKIILDEFINYIYNIRSKKNINIIIHPLDSSEEFFISNGFAKIKRSRFLKNYEGYSSNKDILLYKLKIK